MEDDRLTSEELLETIQKEFPGSEVDVADCERTFYAMMKAWEGPPDVLVLDMFLRWSHHPPETDWDDAGAISAALKGGFQEGGLRCLRATEAQFPESPPVVVIVTALAGSELMGIDFGRAHVLRKELSWTTLLEIIRPSLEWDAAPRRPPM